MRRITSICLVFCMVLGIFAGTALAAAPAYTGKIDPSFAVMLVDADSGTVLYKQHESDPIKPASTTKIMTCILALEHYPSLSEKVTIPPEGDWTNKSNDFSKLDLRNGEEITVKDLLYGMMLVSGDDAADAISMLVGGSKQGFVDMMNAKAQEIGMTSTHFANAGGLDKEDPTVTVSDMATLSIYAMKDPNFRDIVKTFSYDMEATNKQGARTIKNTNKLLDSESEFYYDAATGIKTGSTPKAGGCIVSAASKNGMNLICLVYGEKPSEGTTERWKVSKALYEFGFENYKTIDAASLLDTAEPLQVQVENYAAEDTGAGLLEFKKPDAGTTFVTLEKATAEGLLNGTDSLEATPTYSSETLQAPIKKDDVLGKVVYKSKATGETVFTCDLIASRDVLEAGSSSSGTETAVTTLPPTAPPKNPGQGSGSVWYWLIVPVALIGFLVFRLVTTRRSKRYKKRRPHYSYRIK